MEDPLKLMLPPPEEIPEVIEVEIEVEEEVDSVEEEDKEEVDSEVDSEVVSEVEEVDLWEEEEVESSFPKTIRLLKRDPLFLSRDQRSSFEKPKLFELY